MERWQLISETIAHLEDIGVRPHVVIQTQVPGTCGIPEAYIRPCGHVTLNVCDQATGNSFRIGMYQCQAKVMFNGQHHDVAWHPDAIVGVYSPDGGPKLVFPAPDPDHKPVDRRKPKLSLVRTASDADEPNGNTVLDG